MDILNMFNDPHAVPFGLFGMLWFVAGIGTFWYINRASIDANSTPSAIEHDVTKDR
jgi:hypothetical protein